MEESTIWKGMPYSTGLPLMEVPPPKSGWTRAPVPLQDRAGSRGVGEVVTKVRLHWVHASLPAPYLSHTTSNPTMNFSCRCAVV